MVNVSDRSLLLQHVMPGFVAQKPDSGKLLSFRRHVEPLLSPGMDEVSMIVAIQHWVRSLQGYDPKPFAPMEDGTEDPEQYLEMQSRGMHSVCRRFSYIMLGSLLSAGIEARVVSIAEDLDRHSRNAHTLVEVWLRQAGKWVLIDPTNDAFVMVDGKQASLLEVHEAARAGQPGRISLDQHGASYRVWPAVDTDPHLFRHIYYSRSNAVFDGYRYGIFERHRIEFTHYAGPGIEVYPEMRKELLALLGGASGVLSLYLAARMGLAVLAFWRPRVATKGRATAAVAG